MPTGTDVEVSKYHSYGNDFIVLDADALDAGSQSLFAAAVCHRHFGIGADGCIFVSAAGGEFSMVLYNQDGSLASMSGNGGRCACTYLHHRGLAKDDQIPIRSSAGLRRYTLLESEEGRWCYRSAMGEPDFSPSAIPAAAGPGVEELLDYQLEVDGRKVLINGLWVGNPQCILMVEELPEAEDFAALGGGLATHDFFPEGTNVGFVRVDGPDRLTLRVWERGVGPTWSSGTGSCAAAVVAIRRQRAQSPVTVTTETGSQSIEWSPGAEMVLEGETRFIARCRYHWHGPQGEDLRPQS